jgi:ABC-type nickel/cobalt efflux system permease component RcnA
MGKMRRKLFLFFLLTSLVYGCTLCKLDIPNVHINATMTPQGNSTQFEINWLFDAKFVATLKQYDANKNGIFDSVEQVAIEKSLLEYLARFNYLTQIAYVQKEYKITKDDLQKLKNIETKMVFQNGAMGFSYKFFLPIIPKKGYKIVLFFYDEGNNFNFILRDVILKGYDGKRNIQIQNSKAEIIFDEFIPEAKTSSIQQVVEKDFTFLEQLGALLESYKEKMKNLIEDIKETNSLLSYSWLLFFSFIYGVLHAIGPGHGKSLVSAYFLSENHSLKKALSISLLIGVVHTFSAFILTVTIYFLLNILFANVFDDIEKIATKISGAIIIIIALYLVYKKYTYKKKMTFSVNHPIHNNHSSCGCGSCTTNSTDLGVILAAGIVPCAGTVSVFLFTLGLGVYFVGFLSALFMSLGMSFVIFITAYLSKNIRNQGSSNEKLLKLFEYGSLVFIFFLGMMLIFS